MERLIIMRNKNKNDLKLKLISELNITFFSYFYKLTSFKHQNFKINEIINILEAFYRQI